MQTAIASTSRWVTRSRLDSSPRGRPGGVTSMNWCAGSVERCGHVPGATSRPGPVHHDRHRVQRHARPVPRFRHRHVRSLVRCGPRHPIGPSAAAHRPSGRCGTSRADPGLVRLRERGRVRPFRIHDFSHTVVVPGRGSLPVNVARACRWTWFCSQRYFGDPHPDPRGPHHRAHVLPGTAVAALSHDRVFARAESGLSLRRLLGGDQSELLQ